MDSWKIGDVTVTRILEMSGPPVHPSEWFEDYSEEAIRPHLHWLVPRSLAPVTGMLLWPVQGYLVRTSRHTILVDGCVGNDKTCQYFADWHGRSDDTFLRQLAMAGATPEQVDYVLCSHLHIDHCGWNTRLVDGRWVPTFPNARYVMARREYEAARALASDPKDRTYEDNVLPIVEAGRAVLVGMDHAIDDEVRLEPTPGHTPGHVAIRVRSRGLEAVFSGDLMHWPMQCIFPDWNVWFDADQDTARRTRRTFLEASADDGSLVITAHFPLPSAGRILRRGTSFWFDDQQPA